MAVVGQATTRDRDVTTLAGELRGKPRGLWSDAWRRLRHNRAATAGVIYIVLICLLAVVAPLIAPDNPNYASPTAQSNTPPIWSAGHDTRYLLGTDELARDELSRLIYGTRVSMAVGIVPIAIITVVGLLVGLTAGWAGGWIDNVLMRLVDAVYAFPAFLFFIVLATVLRDTGFGRLLGGLVMLFTAFAIVGWTDMSRLVRSQVLSVKQREYIEAARAIGAPTWRIVMKHVLPNSLAPVIVAIAFGVPSYILAEASLSFLGLGVQASVPSWGSMVFDGFPAILGQPAFVIMPSLLIALIMLAFTFLGDGVRDALDPQAMQ
ncbi:MAG TPA: ABC transporter permease [Thermomicrobiaceae bacterium]|nr:ABC transporter permease [Thermomicrobiaceae bacterium]